MDDILAMAAGCRRVQSGRVLSCVRISGSSDCEQAAEMERGIHSADPLEIQLAAE
jgi:hypothetical protein